MSFLSFSPRRAARAAAVLFLLSACLPGAAAEQGTYHVLEKGETLYSVARAYGIKPEDIAKANSIADPSRLHAGRKLLIPADPQSASGQAAAPSTAVETSSKPATHKVAKGETLFSIAKSYGVSLDGLKAANKLTSSSLLKAGDTLTIPTSESAIAASTSSKASASDSTSTEKDVSAAPPSVPSAGPAAGPGTGPAMPEAVKTSVKAVSKGLSWPCPGDLLYLDGKAYGVIIRAKLGEPVRAVTAGTVSSAGPYRGYGNVVFVLARGYIYVYGGSDTISVRAGDQVKAGQELGRVGIDAKQGGPTAYFFVFKNGAAVDPASAPRD